MFFKTLRYDIKNGIFTCYKSYLIIAVISVAFCADYFVKYNQLINSFQLPNKLSFGDYAMYVFAGKEEFSPAMGNVFSFPAVWTLIMALLMYITLNYPFDDITGFGRHVLMNSKSRRIWWLSKCAWSVISCALAYALILSVCFIFSLITKAQLSLQVSNYAIAIAKQTSEYFMYNDTKIGVLLLLPLLLLCQMSLFQMTASILLKPTISFLITIAHLIAAAFYMTPYLPANYSMFLRYDIVTPTGLRPLTGVIISSVIIVIAVIVGMIAFSKYDILSKE